MKKLNLRGISEILSEKELKNVMGGSSGYGWCYSPEDICTVTCSDGYSTSSPYVSCQDLANSACRHTGVGSEATCSGWCKECES